MRAQPPRACHGDRLRNTMGFHSENDRKSPGAAKCIVQGSLYRPQSATPTPFLADTELTKSLKSNILSYLNSKYEGIQDFLNFTTFLDPRFRTQHISEEETQTLKERAISELMVSETTEFTGKKLFNVITNF